MPDSLETRILEIRDRSTRVEVGRAGIEKMIRKFKKNRLA